MQIPLVTGDYQARSVIAAAQRCVNLYGERNPQDSPFPYTYYPRAGLTQRIAGASMPGRCAYRASDGSLYEVVGQTVYYTNPMWQRTALGQLAGTLATPVSMSDNGLVILIVDGSTNGYCIDMTTRQFGVVSGQGAAFFGGDRVDEVDTFFLLNVPGTNQWYISLSEVNFANLTGTVSPDTTAAAFDPLDIAAKTGNPDPLAGVIAMHREVWLVGTETSEIWYDAGSPDFVFSELPGVFIEHGCVAKYSLVKEDLNIFWLSLDRQGQAIVLMGNRYAATRISTHAIEQQIQSYGKVSDAIAWTYQQLGHTYYALTFPTADATWVYDIGERMWHEETWIDGDGREHRSRLTNAANVYGVNVGQDWQTGALYQIDPAAYTDAGQPIVKRRGFPIIRNDGNRVAFSRLQLDFACGNVANTLSNVPGGVTNVLTDTQGQIVTDPTGSPVIGGYTLAGGSPGYNLPLGPKVFLRWSNDGGVTWGNPLMQTIGATGQFDRFAQFLRLGMARRRVFETFWDSAFLTALNGADLTATPCGT